MSVRSSSSSSGAGASPVPPVTVPVTSSGSLKQLQPYGYDSCTYTKTKDTKNLYGCYLFRSCQSCLETDGCMINDLGICVSQSQGMRNLDADSYQYSTSYYSEMNYLKAVGKNLSLPKAQTDNKDALAAEQNWHFRAGEATYCKADDAVCKECKASNFWRSNDTNTLPDSRFCVGANNCVCIQTCEVPTFKSPGCQWKLSAAPSPSPYYGYYNNGYDRTEVTHLAYWEWLLVVLVIIVVHLLFRACSGSKASQLEAARQEAVRAVRRELGIPEDEPVTAPARSAPVLRPLRRTATEATDESSVHESDAQEVKTPRHGAEDSVADSQTVFVEIDDAHATPSTQPPTLSTRTEG